MMKRLLLGLMLLVTAGAASAEWTRVDNDDDDDALIVYVDKATIRRNGNFVKMWDLMDNKTVQMSAAGESYLSSKAQWEFDCKEEKVRMLAFIRFDGKMGSRNVVSNGNVSGEWSPISPGSLGTALWKIACGKK